MFTRFVLEHCTTSYFGNLIKYKYWINLAPQICVFRLKCIVACVVVLWLDGCVIHQCLNALSFIHSWLAIIMRNVPVMARVLCV